MHRITRLILAALLALSSYASAATVWQFSLDTSSLAGSEGYLDFQFNPASASAPAFDAVLSDFVMGSGMSLSGAATVDGDVGGALPGDLVFANSTPFNAVLQPVVFGGEFSLTIAFSGDPAAMALGDGSLFTLGLLDADFANLLSGNIDTPVLSFDLLPGNGLTVTALNGTVTAVPEADRFSMMLAGLAMVMWIVQRRRAWR